MKILVSPNFDLREFIPPEIFSQFGERSVWFLDPRIIAACEAIREHFDHIIWINTWHLQGEKKYSGYRPPDCKTGAFLSQHKFGRAADIRVGGFESEQVREVIREYWVKFGVTCIEKDTPTWVHIDVRNTGLDYLMEVPYQ